MGDPPKRRATVAGAQRASKKGKAASTPAAPPTAASDDCWPSEGKLPVFVTELTENDVLLGRGAPVIQNVGNARYRSLVKSHKGEYAKAQRHSEKDAIARQILKEVTKRNGKFLRRVATEIERKKLGAPDEFTAVWAVVDFQNALEKTKQTLREKNCNRASDLGSGETQETSPTAASESVARMPQPNWGGVPSLPASGIGGEIALGAGAATLSTVPGGFMPPTVSGQLASLMMERNSLQQYPGSPLFLNDQQLALRLMMQQQQQQQSSPFAQAPPQQLAVDNQMALHRMMQRHNVARANRVQQQQMALSLQGRQQQPLSSSPPSRLSLEQELARTEAANAATASLLGLPSLQQYQQQQQQQLAAAAFGRFPSAGLLGVAASSPSPHLQATANGGNAIDSSDLAFHQQQQEEGMPVPRSTSATTNAATEGRQQRVEEQNGNGGSDRPLKKRSSRDDGSSSSGTGSRGSSIGSEEDAELAAQKTSKPHTEMLHRSP